VIGLDFIIPTESQCQFQTILPDDKILIVKIKKKVNSPYAPQNDPLCPDFMLALDSSLDQIELVRAGTNTISSTQLKHAEKARLSKANPNDGENPIFVFTCEKDTPRVQIRIWLIFPSELKMLLELEKAEKINDQSSCLFIKTIGEIVSEVYWLGLMRSLMRTGKELVGVDFINRKLCGFNIFMFVVGRQLRLIFPLN
jgi:hypothetical protein